MIKLKEIASNFFKSFWEETTVKISERDALELGGFIISLIIFLGILFLLNTIGVIS